MSVGFLLLGRRITRLSGRFTSFIRLRPLLVITSSAVIGMKESAKSKIDLMVKIVFVSLLRWEVEVMVALEWLRGWGKHESQKFFRIAEAFLKII